MEFKLKALTPIWTGGVDVGTKKNDFLHETGIIGSLRWWYEALVRGLGGYVCDPREGGCKFNTKDYEKAKKEGKPIKECLEIGFKDVCSVCRFFGCTGWSKKFIFRITDVNENIKNTPIDSEDNLNILFKAVKSFDEEEKWLLINTFKIIGKYGSIGGKTVFKPSDHGNNDKFHHLDFGLIKVMEYPTIPSIAKGKIKDYVKNSQRNQPDWPDLNNFWFVQSKYINRTQHNKIVNRNDKGSYIKDANLTPTKKFLGGYIPKERVGPANETASKKIFSFHGEKSGVKRCWGYTKKDEYNSVVNLITNNSEIKSEDIIKGEVIIDGL